MIGDSLTSKERVRRTLEHKPADRLAFMLTPWGETIKRWTDEGHLQPNEDITEHFGQDIKMGGWPNYTADLDHRDVVIEETEDTILARDGNGATLRRHKKHECTPEHVDFLVKDRTGWEEYIKPRLLNIDRRRIPFEDYRTVRASAVQHNRFFCWHGVGPFELMHPICGHEYMLMGMALDPEWVKDMVMTYVDLTIRHLEVLFAEEGIPDALFFYEDMGFKFKPFMSPAMYKEIIFPGHKQLFDYAHSKGCYVIVHSCGYVEPLVPGLIEAGMDCLQAMEVKAGMDMPTMFEKFGDHITFFGNIDVRTLISNDTKCIDEELCKKIAPVVSNGGSYILHTDHSEPPEVNYDTVRYFIERGLQIGREAAARFVNVP